MFIKLQFIYQIIIYSLQVFHSALQCCITVFTKLQLYLENKGSIWEEQKSAHFRDKTFLLHLKNVSARRTNVLF